MLRFNPVSQTGKLLCLNAATETTFYLANRFRYTLLINSAIIETSSSEKALLGLMRQMFNLGIGDAPNAPGASEAAQKFSIKNFLECYKHFFRSTLLYEAGSLTFRTSTYEYFVRR